MDIELPSDSFSEKVDLRKQILRKPEYIARVLTYGDRNDISAEQRDEYDEAKRLLSLFDAKPFVVRCSASQCPNMAVKVSVYGNNVDPVPWCGECNPYSAGASAGKLHVLSVYEAAIIHIRLYCNGSATDLRILVKELGRMKGIERISKKALDEFFS